MRSEKELLEELEQARQEVAVAEGEFFPILDDQPTPEHVMEANPPKELEEAGVRLERARKRLRDAERAYEQYIRVHGKP